MDRKSLIFVILLSTVLYLMNQYFGSLDDKRKKEHITQKVEQKQTVATTTPEVSIPKPSSHEQFYVLENDYVQLVFSNIGGALSEINLPFESDKNTKSVVRPIEFDHIFQEDFAANDHFPLRPAFQVVNGSVKKRPVGAAGGYYPLIRRTLLPTDTNKGFIVPPRYYALNIISDQVAIENADYKVTEFTSDKITFETSFAGRKIVKSYTLPSDKNAVPYCFDVEIKVDGDTSGLKLTSGIPEVELISDAYTPTIKYRTTGKNGKAIVEKVDLPKTFAAIPSILPDWVCNSNGFLGIIVDPLSDSGVGFNVDKVSGTVAPSRITLIGAEYDTYPADKYPGYEVDLPIRVANQAMKFRVFTGPFENAVLKQVDAIYLKDGVDTNYAASQSFHGWFSFISEPFAKFLFFLMKIFHAVTGSWGISIVLLTVALRVMLYPLNAWSIKSSLKMQEVAPIIASIQERFKDDPKRAQTEVMSIYRQKGVNPFTGCFPLLIQMPFLIGMFDLLKSSFELRGASFIPGWINNLTAPDVVFSWKMPIPFIGNQLHLLPIILGAVMWVQQWMTMAGNSKKGPLSDQQKQQKMMGNIMVVVFTFMFYNFPSGLNIYWLSSMLLGILQQWYMKKNYKPEGLRVVK